MKVLITNHSSEMIFVPGNKLDESLLAALYSVVADGGTIGVKPNDSQKPIVVEFTKPGKRIES